MYKNFKNLGFYLLLMSLLWLCGCGKDTILFKDGNVCFIPASGAETCTPFNGNNVALMRFGGGDSLLFFPASLPIGNSLDTLIDSAYATTFDPQKTYGLVRNDSIYFYNVTNADTEITFVAPKIDAQYIMFARTSSADQAAFSVWADEPCPNGDDISKQMAHADTLSYWILDNNLYVSGGLGVLVIEPVIIDDKPVARIRKDLRNEFEQWVDKNDPSVRRHSSKFRPSLKPVEKYVRSTKSHTAISKKMAAQPATGKGGDSLSTKDTIAKSDSIRWVAACIIRSSEVSISRCGTWVSFYKSDSLYPLAEINLWKGPMRFIKKDNSIVIEVATNHEFDLSGICNPIKK
jgi:hypothetical protein